MTTESAASKQTIKCTYILHLSIDVNMKMTAVVSCGNFKLHLFRFVHLSAVTNHPCSRTPFMLLEVRVFLFFFDFCLLSRLLASLLDSCVLLYYYNTSSCKMWYIYTTAFCLSIIVVDYV